MILHAQSPIKPLKSHRNQDTQKASAVVRLPKIDSIYTTMATNSMATEASSPPSIAAKYQTTQNDTTTESVKEMKVYSYIPSHKFKSFQDKSSQGFLSKLKENAKMSMANPIH